MTKGIRLNRRMLWFGKKIDSFTTCYFLQYYRRHSGQHKKDTRSKSDVDTTCAIYEVDFLIIYEARAATGNASKYFLWYHVSHEKFHLRVV